METRRFFWLIVGTVVLLTISLCRAEKFGVGENGRSVNDFGKSDNQNVRGGASYDRSGRKKRLAQNFEPPQVSSIARNIVGKTFNFSHLETLTKNVTLTFSGIPINLAQFRVEQADVINLDNFLRGGSLADRLYVVSKLAGIEQYIATAQKQRLTTLAIEDLVNGDIVHTRESVNELETEIQLDPTGPTGRVRRKAAASERLKWPTLIRYVVASDFNSDVSTRNAINDAVLHWEEETCLNFVKVNSYSGPHLVFKRRIGCWSYVGKQGNAQTISIGHGCETKGIIAHEIGHAIGFWHEQSRPDRSMYVNIHWANIQPGSAHNFFQYSWRDILALGIPYDYSSVMHYGTHFFSKNGQKTISAKETEMNVGLGSRFALSFYDAKLANYKYCSTRCSGGLTWSSCRNDGYRDPKNCNKCKCPDGWTGTYCTNVANSVNANCGLKYLTATSAWKTLSSPNYDTSGLPANSECTWLLRTYGSYRRVVVQFIDTFQVQSYCSVSCSNYLEVRHKLSSKPGPRYCCSRPTTLFKSHGSDILLLMRINSGSGLKGFKIRYKYEISGGNTSPSSLDGPASIETLPFTCYGTYSSSCGLFLWGRCTRYRKNRCYKEVKKCSSGFKLIGSWCYRYGTWSLWGSWSSCTVSCGGCGEQTRSRICDKPHCSGSSQQAQRCNTQVCPPVTISRSCTVRYKSSWWWGSRTTYRSTYCYAIRRCCGGHTQQGSQCV